MIYRHAFLELICTIGTVLVMMVPCGTSSLAQESYDDLVVLRDGRFFVGRITKMEARCRLIPDIDVTVWDSVLTLEGLEGETKTIPWPQIQGLTTYEQIRIVPKQKSYQWDMCCCCVKKYGKWLLELRGGVHYTRDRDIGKNKWYPAGEAMLSYFLMPQSLSVGLGMGGTSIRDVSRFPVYVHLRVTTNLRICLSQGWACMVPHAFVNAGLPFDKYVFNSDYSGLTIGKNYWLFGIGGGMDIDLGKQFDLALDAGYRYYSLGEEALGQAYPSLRIYYVHSIFLRLGLNFEL